MQLTVLSYNTLFAGREGTNDVRARAQIELINQIHPDVFLMQEAKGFDANGGAWLYAMEEHLGLRGFLAVAPGTGQHVAIFIRTPLRPLSFEPDSGHFHHALATLKVAVPGVSEPITFLSAHLCPNGPDVRRREAAYLAVQVAPEKLTLLGGDFNAASPHDPEPEGFNVLPAHHRIRYLDDGLVSADRTVLARLEAAGWVDLGNQLDARKTATVPTQGYPNAEFANMRCDYLLASASLAKSARHYEVVRTAATDLASDHYPVLARFELS
ncbi:endonuclease/exonuclease/phosphatase family protein [Robbsia sp. Bb-Pol-6]|uniref:Endonuclease/exonuclease/phosphatase family protein n=1 Tax=Robbsia betulipollinis TaxID=2981849 RepID=A0ABT3ZPL4_9BURK|nr:endonuclease/exonuclease/phosphatase family protein [Robbsia betulipollinis]MCY0388422.1 endonuclease/exonuclease/phosphatase family protein [Robbsia betulipollinis]